MRARVALSALLLTALATLTSGPARRVAGGPAAAHAGAWSLARGEYGSDLQLAVFSTETSYDAEGNRIPFANGRPGKLQQLGLSWRNEIGWRKKLSLQFGISGLSVTGFEGPPVVTPSATGMSAVDLGLHYNIMNGDRALAVEAGWVAPAGYDRELTRALGDGRQALAGRLNFGSTLGRHGFFELSGGASYRFHKLGSSDDVANMDPRLTTNVYWTAGADLGLWVGRSMLIGGRYQGQWLGSTTGVGDASNVHYVGPMMLSGDEQIDATTHRIGPLFLFRLDDRVDMTAGSASTPTGKNTLHFDQFYLSLTFKQSKLKRNQGFLGGSAP